MIVEEFVLTPWQSFAILAVLGFLCMGLGVVMGIVGRSGMRSKDISPGSRAVCEIFFFGGWLPIILGIGILLLAVASLFL